MSKLQRYNELLPQIASLINGESDKISVLANVCAVLKEEMKWFWVGFYLKHDNELRLGPFQGPVACMHIPFDRGVCGAAYSQARTIVVEDVEQFPDHIACSSLSRSEIVVPVFYNNKEVVGVLDIDSKELAAFDAIDQQKLEAVCQLITQTLYNQ